MSLPFADNLNIQMRKQNVERDAFKTLEDMKSYPESSLPSIFHALCEEDGIMYIYNSSNEVDEITGKWRPLTAEDPNLDLSDYAKKSELHSHDNKDILNRFSTDDDGNILYDGSPIRGEQVDLSSYAKKNELHSHINKLDVLDKLSASDNGDLLFNGNAVNKDPNLSNYATKDDLHEHSNKSILDKLTKNSDGDLLFNGNYINGVDKNSHSHDNKDILNRFSTDDDGNILYDGSPIRGEQVDLSSYATKDDLHNHSNKSILDNLSASDNGDLLFNGNAVNKDPNLSNYATKDDLHEHSNKSILDNLSASDNGDLLFNGNYINGVDKNSHTHDNKDILNRFSTDDDGNILYDGLPISGGDVDLSNYATKDDLHNHSNKSILDNLSIDDVNNYVKYGDKHLQYLKLKWDCTEDYIMVDAGITYNTISKINRGRAIRFTFAYNDYTNIACYSGIISDVESISQINHTNDVKTVSFEYGGIKFYMSYVNLWSASMNASIELFKSSNCAFGSIGGSSLNNELLNDVFNQIMQYANVIVSEDDYTNRLNAHIIDNDVHVNKDINDIINKLSESADGDLLFNGNAINGVDENSHTHDNKDTLDKFSESADGNILYNGSPISSSGDIDLNSLYDIGKIIEYTGDTIPEGYLKCDGSIYNIADYPELAAYIKYVYGSINRFGGDGEITFAVPVSQIPTVEGVDGNAFGSNRGFETGPFSNAFDGDITTSYVSDYTVLLPKHIGFKFNNYETISSYSITNPSTISMSPKTWKLQGSNDGSTWDDIDSQSDITWESGRMEKQFILDNTYTYKQYRLYITSTPVGSGSNSVAVCELKFYPYNSTNIWIKYKPSDINIPFHYNKSILDKFSESADGDVLFNGNAINDEYAEEDITNMINSIWQ